jgi:hypothetical protein
MKLSLCVLMLLAGTGCAGRRVATTFTEMESHVTAGTTLYVTTSDGKAVKGTLATVSGSSLKMSLADRSTRDFREVDVARIRTKDTLWNGMLIGAAAGGFLTFAINDGSCIVPYAATDCRKVSRGAGVAIGAAIGAAIGTGVDVLHHRRVFRGTVSAQGASLIVAPVANPHMAAILLSSRF